MTVEPSNAKSSSPTRSDAFALQLHAKLWENINTRESRIYTFLGIYGAALGVLYSTSAPVGVGIPGGIVMLLLSLWAARIITTADWWSVRNRLMIQRIEDMFPEVCDSAVPSSYRQYGYSSESLNRFSVGLVAAAALVLYSSVGYGLVAPHCPLSYFKLSGLAFLAAFLLYSTSHIVAKRMSNIRQYWDLVNGYSQVEHLKQRTCADQVKYGGVGEATAYIATVQLLTSGLIILDRQLCCLSAKLVIPSVLGAAACVLFYFSRRARTPETPKVTTSGKNVCCALRGLSKFFWNWSYLLLAVGGTVSLFLILSGHVRQERCCWNLAAFTTPKACELSPVSTSQPSQQTGPAGLGTSQCASVLAK